MTGPEHYREAERLLGEFKAVKSHGIYTITPNALVMAQVHATLAVAAATAEPFAAHRGACDSCSAPIIWARTVNGKRMPVDAEPHGEGNVQLTERPAGHAPLATVHSLPLISTHGDAIGPVHRSHFATCPNAEQHRRSR